MNKLNKLVSSGLLLVLSGCATVAPPEKLATPDYSKLYLRGVFNWWEAEEKFKVSQVQPGVYQAEVELIADGEPYDFKFADKDWTPGLSCGATQGDAQIVKLGRKLYADCFKGPENFKFLPSSTGRYQFLIEFNVGTKPLIYIRKQP